MNAIYRVALRLKGRVVGYAGYANTVGPVKFSQAAIFQTRAKPEAIVAYYGRSVPGSYTAHIESYPARSNGSASPGVLMRPATDEDKDDAYQAQYSECLGRERG